MKVYVHKKTCTWVSVVPLFMWAGNWKETKYPSPDKQINQAVIYPYHRVLLSTEMEWLWWYLYECHIHMCCVLPFLWSSRTYKTNANDRGHNSIYLWEVVSWKVHCICRESSRCTLSMFWLSKNKSSPGWCGSVDWGLAYEPKDRWFDSQSGHVPGLQARSPVGGVWETTTPWCFSCSLSPSLPLSLKISK